MPRAASSPNRRSSSSFAAAVLCLVAVLSLHQPHGTEGFLPVSPLPQVAGIRTRTQIRTSPSASHPLVPGSEGVVSATPESRATPTALSAVPGDVATTMAIAATTTATSRSTEWLFNTDVWVFAAGIFPFLWATYEFWRRIMFGEAFGTGTDSVLIGMEDSPQDSRGIRVLGKGALVTAYVLFTLAFGTLAVVLYSVLTSEAPSPEALAAAATAQAAAGGTDAL